jgi:soluble lytic murein transglycosylase
MFQVKRITAVMLVAASAMFILPGAQAEKQAAYFYSDDEIFQALRESSRRDEMAKSIDLAARIPNYAIPSYVEYFRLKPRIGRLPAAEIRDFLARYDGTAIADRLRDDWLLELGRQRDWNVFDEQYPLFVQNDDLQVKCYALMSRAAKGYPVGVDALTLLTSPKDYGDACHSLLATLAQSNQIDADDVWGQIRLAVETGATSAAIQISALTDVDQSILQRAIEKPSVTVKKGPHFGSAAHQMYIIALGRFARTDPQQAADALIKAVKKLKPQEQAQAWAQIALQASYKLAPEASSAYWSKVADAPLSSEGYQWRVRMALREGDWAHVKSSIEAMPVAMQGSPVWVYWKARALMTEGKQPEAQSMFATIAHQPHFYGQLATEELGEKITIPPAGLPVTAAEIAPIAANPGFRRAIKLLELNMRPEGIREWNWELKKLGERETLAAAEFARQNNLLDRMVSTSDRTKTEFDFTQRFPSPYRDVMAPTTQALGLDLAWVYGLIRQESRFVQVARSQVGASGLMQLMPATAQFVARKIGLSNFSQHRVSDIDINIQLGANYLNMVLQNLDASQTMATAAYNAGPGRPRAWRSTLNGPVEGAVFAETIPFSETRGYVKNVLANATYYAALFDGKPQSLKARLGTIAPKSFEAPDLP